MLFLGLNMIMEGDGKNDGRSKSLTVRVSLEKIVEGMDFQSDEVSSYLNRTTGNVVVISDETFSAVEDGESEDPVTGEPLDEARAVLDGTDYIPLPDRFEINEYQIMERFAGSISDIAASNQILAAIRGSGAFRRFKDTIHALELAESWYGFRARAYEEIAIDWCKQNGIEQP